MNFADDDIDRLRKYRATDVEGRMLVQQTANLEAGRLKFDEGQ